jgi:hypothetical protein
MHSNTSSPSATAGDLYYNDTTGKLMLYSSSGGGGLGADISILADTNSFAINATTLTMVSASGSDIAWSTDGGGDVGTSSSAGRPDNVHAKTSMTIAGNTVVHGGTTAGGALTGTYPNPDLSNSEVSSTSTYTCSNTSYEDVTSMSITPAAGTYMVWYNCYTQKGDTDSDGAAGIFVDTTIHTDSYREFSIHAEKTTFGTQALISVNGSQAIKVRARVGNGSTSWQHLYRSLTILKITD